jgi:hypothetical protein
MMIAGPSRAGTRVRAARTALAAIALCVSAVAAGAARADVDGGGFARIVIPSDGATRLEGGANLRVEDRAWIDRGHPVADAPVPCGPLATDPKSLCLEFHRWNAAGAAGAEIAVLDFAAVADLIAAEADPLKAKRASGYLADARASWDIGLRQTAEEQLRHAVMTLYGTPETRER